MIRRTVILAGFALGCATLAFGDFQYQQTTKITGGSLMSMMRMMGRFSGQAKQALDPVTQAVYLKGNRMAEVGKDSTQIIDLDQETITHIDHAKREYYVMTFEQMKKAMEDSAKQMEQKMKERPVETAQPAGQTADRPEVTFHAKVRDGGQSKQFSGLDTKLTILTLEMEAKDKESGQKGAMAVTADMWLAPEIPGYGAVREFHRKMAVKMGMMMAPGMAQMAGMQSSMFKGFGDLAKESSKLKGVPIFQVTRMGATADGQPLPPASEAPLPPSKDPDFNLGQAAGDAATQSATQQALGRLGGIGKLGGLGGGLGGFGKKKKQEPPPEQPVSSPSQAATASVLMEMETEISGFSSGAVDASSVAVPSGYKQIERPDPPRRGR